MNRNWLGNTYMTRTQSRVQQLPELLSKKPDGTSGSSAPNRKAVSETQVMNPTKNQNRSKALLTTLQSNLTEPSISRCKDYSESTDGSGFANTPWAQLRILTETNRPKTPTRAVHTAEYKGLCRGGCKPARTALREFLQEPTTTVLQGGVT